MLFCLRHYFAYVFSHFGDFCIDCKKTSRLYWTTKGSLCRVRRYVFFIRFFVHQILDFFWLGNFNFKKPAFFVAGRVYQAWFAFHFLVFFHDFASKGTVDFRRRLHGLQRAALFCFGTSWMELMSHFYCLCKHNALSSDQQLPFCLTRVPTSGS